jgi:hypothetical protein
MRLVGWNDIPAGYGADFDLREAPLWLRVWFSTPLLDRFAYPVAVRRGYGWLMPQPGCKPVPVGDGWRVRPADYVAPGSVAFLPRSG